MNEVEMRRAQKQRVWTPGDEAEILLETREFLETLVPMRPPFLFVDAVLKFDRQAQALTATRKLAADDPVFAAHMGVYPGMLLLETMAQSLLAVCALLRDGKLGHVRLSRVREATFLRAVLPETQLEIVAKTLEINNLRALGIAQAIDSGMVACVALFEVQFLG